jgi:Leucine-rich repeat (LRR) protein
LVLHTGGNYLGPTVPENIGQLGSLTHLDLSRNGITALGEALFGLTRLSTLVLSRNSLAQLPPLIGQLTALTCLKVRHDTTHVNVVVELRWRLTMD